MSKAARRSFFAGISTALAGAYAQMGSGWRLFREFLCSLSQFWQASVLYGFLLRLKNDQILSRVMGAGLAWFAQLL
ncbi:hypothetical protein [Pseudomonas sp. PA15(2017)]|uniref:hypothetical protein n=1 Tax=Pseudomonas sp. PA15(2017) TaxID=1932111 RepID=UPI00117B31CD|nr:hypothetical protein [Pseudomonas sp. PA15(2017)]